MHLNKNNRIELQNNPLRLFCHLEIFDLLLFPAELKHSQIQTLFPLQAFSDSGYMDIIRGSGMSQNKPDSWTVEWQSWRLSAHSCLPTVSQCLEVPL